MSDVTRRLWAEQEGRHPGDRLALFSAIRDVTGPARVLYPGSYVDIAPSFVFGHVTYLDMDRRAARFFADQDTVDAIISERRDGPSPEWEFMHADYTTDLDLDGDSFDLLISLYAGFVSEHCTEFLRPGGILFVNPSHGDAAMASIDARYRLRGVVHARSGSYSVTDRDLDSYLIPKTSALVTVDGLHESGRGVAYTKRAFGYLFERLAG